MLSNIIKIATIAAFLLFIVAKFIFNVNPYVANILYIVAGVLFVSIIVTIALKGNIFK